MFSFPIQAEPIVLVTGEWAPFTSETIEGYGFITEIVTLTLQHMGLEPEYQFYPWKRCENLVERGRAWAAFPYGYTEERAQTFLFSDIISDSQSKFFYYNKQKEVFHYEQLEDVKAYKVGGVFGYFYEKLFQEADIIVYYTYTEEEMFNALVHGRIDLVPQNEMVGWDLIKKNYPNQIAKFGTLAKPLASNPLRLMVSKIYPESQTLLDQFNTALKKIQEIDEYQAILEKYGIR